MWLSLVEHYVRDVGAAGSNPVIPTTFLPQLVFRGVAQLVARASGGRGAAGSSPVTPTIPSVLTELERFCMTLGFLLTF